MALSPQAASPSVNVLQRYAWSSAVALALRCMLRSHAFSKELLTRHFHVPGVANRVLSSNVLSQTLSNYQQSAGPSTERRLQCFRRPYHMVSRCQAFVGERTESAQEYHTADFDFYEHKDAVDEQLANDPSAYQIPESSGDFVAHAWTLHTRDMLNLKPTLSVKDRTHLTLYAHMQGPNSSPSSQSMRHGKHFTRETMQPHASIKSAGEPLSPRVPFIRLPPVPRMSRRLPLTHPAQVVHWNCCQYRSWQEQADSDCIPVSA